MISLVRYYISDVYTKDVVYLSTDKKRRLNNTDRRVKRTKKALRDALFSLLEEKTINQISVTELTTLADVNRATFYFYYTDLLDMLQQIQNETYQLLEEVLCNPTASISTVEGFAEYAENLFNFCKEHETLVKFIVKNDTNNQVYKQVQSLMLNNIPNTKETFEKENPARYSTNFILNAMVGVMIEWMNEGMLIPPRDMAEFCAQTYLSGSAKAKQFFTSK